MADVWFVDEVSHFTEADWAALYKVMRERLIAGKIANLTVVTRETMPKNNDHETRLMTLVDRACEAVNLHKWQNADVKGLRAKLIELNNLTVGMIRTIDGVAPVRGAQPDYNLAS